MMFQKRGPLYAGVAKYVNPNGEEGTIVSAVFSKERKFWENKEFSAERRNQNYCKNWFVENRTKASIRYGILDSDFSVFDDFMAVPIIINYFIGEKHLRPNEIKLSFWGSLSEDTATSIRESLIGLRGIEKVSIKREIPKSPEENQTEKRIFCPQITYCSNILAKAIYSGDCFFSTHAYQVPINLPL